MTPNDLVGNISRDDKGQFYKQVVRQVETTFKITLLPAGLTWVIHILDFSNCQPPIKTVYQTERVTPEFDLLQLYKTLKESNLTPSISEVRTRADWVRKQQRYQIKPLRSGTEGYLKYQMAAWYTKRKEAGPLKMIVSWDDIDTMSVSDTKHNLIGLGGV